MSKVLQGGRSRHENQKKRRERERKREITSKREIEKNESKTHKESSVLLRA